MEERKLTILSISIWNLPGASLLKIEGKISGSLTK